MLAVETAVLVRNQGVGHGASGATGQNGVLVTEGLGPDGERPQLDFLLPLGDNNQLGQLIIAGAGSFVAFEFGGHFGQGVVDVGSVDKGEFVVSDFGDKEPA